ncbi:NAD(P)-binding protein [Lepidopterella palustris CBS 459.81]|uniref:NAD(P)-binding protein n=1 Tax=Lepidopterella palustris CBS 459.81 TaxID=1314670 RepID=A0A8E2E0M9_9PEZI|nr:NAD(P)-binding protein [Lepidopterella palustris CBS 459.81]
MRALVLSHPKATKPGDCFTYDTKYPKPSLPSDDWVLVRIHSIGLNRAELRAREAQPVSIMEYGIFMNEYHPGFPCPPIIGEEFVGEVAEVGKNAAAGGLAVGDRVAGWAYGGGKAHNGSYAEYTICHRLRCWKMGPAAKDVDWDVLGAIPMGLWTAYGAIFSAGMTKPGDTVLVHGATSSVGLWGVLCAKDQGCTVIATTRQESKLQKLKDTGADYVFLESELPQKVKEVAPEGVQCVLELVGLEAVESIAMPVTKRGGVVVKCGILGNAWKYHVGAGLALPGRYLTSWTTLQEDFDWAGKVLVETVEKVKSGKFKKEHFLDAVFDIEQVGEAHEYMEANKATGKVVLHVP